MKVSELVKFWLDTSVLSTDFMTKLWSWSEPVYISTWGTATPAEDTNGICMISMDDDSEKLYAVNLLLDALDRVKRAAEEFSSPSRYVLRQADTFLFRAYKLSGRNKLSAFDYFYFLRISYAVLSLLINEGSVADKPVVLHTSTDYLCSAELNGCIVSRDCTSVQYRGIAVISSLIKRYIPVTKLEKLGIYQGIGYNSLRATFAGQQAFGQLGIFETDGEFVLASIVLSGSLGLNKLPFTVMSCYLPYLLEELATM